MFDGRLHSRHRMRRQQLQHANILTHARERAVAFFQTLSKLQKHGGKCPVAVHVRMIQSRRPPLQSRQIVQRIKHLIATRIASNVCRNDCVLMNNFDAIDVALHRHRLKRTLPRRAVADVVEPSELIFVDLHLLTKAGVERMLRQPGRQCFLFVETHANRLRLPAADALEFTHAALAQSKRSVQPNPAYAEPVSTTSAQESSRDSRRPVSRCRFSACNTTARMRSDSPAPRSVR